MNNLAYDTLGTSKKLEETGMERKQAEAIAIAIAEREGRLATKSDIDLLKGDIGLVKDEINSLRSENKSLRSDVKTEINSLRSEINSLRTEVKSDMASQFRWLMGMQVVTILTMVGLVVSLA